MTTARKTAATLRAVTYTRISRDDEGRAEGVRRQAETLQRIATGNNARIVEKLVDNDLSASDKVNRPAFNRLLEMIEHGDVDIVLIDDPDRLSRGFKSYVTFYETCQAARVKVVWYGGEADFATGDGLLTLDNKLSFAREELRRMSRRVSKQKADRRAHGLPPGGSVPFGWKTRVLPDPVQSKVLLKAMDDVLGGESLSNIARRWNEQRQRGRTTWDANNIAKVLTRPHHAGLLIHRGVVLDTVGTWKPLITRAKYEALVATVAGRSALGSTTPRRRSLLTGLLVCGICGKPMYRATTGKTSDPHSRRTWRCNPLPRTGGCGRVSIRAAAIEPLLVEATMQYVDTVDLAKLLSKHGAPDNTARDLAALDKRAAEFGAAAAMGKFNPTAMAAFTKTIDAQRDALRAKLGQQVRSDVLAPYVGRPGALRAAWTTLSTDQQRSIISESLHAVTVLPAEHRGQRFETKRVVWRKR